MINHKGTKSAKPLFLYALCAFVVPLFSQISLVNGNFWTADSKVKARAVTITGDRITWVGDKPPAGGRVIDLKGRFAMPGFIDNHTHFTTGGFQLLGVDLRPAKSPQEFIEILRAHVAKVPKGEWITGGDWDDQAYSPPQLPRRDWMDSFTPETPVFVRRYDGHMGVANSLALSKAGITRETKDPPGGAIVRDANGEPAGVLRDAAMDLVERVIPQPTEEQLTRAARAALADARRLGLTGVQDMSSYADLRVYQKLLEAGELTTRIYARTPLARWQDVARIGLRSGFGGDFLKVGSLKGFMDGSLGSTTAVFFQPYLDAPNSTGLYNSMAIPLANMEKMIVDADRAGLQLSIHAIGDRAISELLDMFEKAERANGPRDRRFRVEHAQHMAAKDFERMARMKVIASVQPYHAIDDGRWAEKRIGPGRAKTTYAFRTFLDKGVPLAFGSDWFVAPLNPMLGVYAAVTRATLDGQRPGGWVPEEKISVAQALHAYTMGNAYAAFEENLKGSLTPGKLADIVILSADPFTVPPEKLKDIQVEMTILGGKVVYERK
jgi:hypothetical protein